MIYLLNNQLNSVDLFAILIFSWLLLALSAIDFEQGYLPDRLTYLLLWLGLFYACFAESGNPVQAILGAGTGYLSLWLIAVLYQIICHRRGMGAGDFKLAAGLGGWVGFDYLIAMIWMASVFALLVFLFYYLCCRVLPKSLPFGPYLSISGWVILLMDLRGVPFFPFLIY